MGISQERLAELRTLRANVDQLIAQIDLELTWTAPVVELTRERLRRNLTDRTLDD
jgi:hypothetical protein